MQMSRHSNLGVAILCMSLGGFLVLVACGLISDGPNQRDAPDLIVALSGTVFIIAGCMILVGRQSRLNDLLAAILCLIFGLIGAWVAIFSSSDGFSGGLPFLSSEANIKLGRIVFGLGSLICFAISGWAMSSYAKRVSAQR